MILKQCFQLQAWHAVLPLKEEPPGMLFIRHGTRNDFVSKLKESLAANVLKFSFQYSNNPCVWRTKFLFKSLYDF